MPDTSPDTASEMELFARCVRFVIVRRQASPSLLQRHFGIGYGRAARIIAWMEDCGIISAPHGFNRARKVLLQPVEENGMEEEEETPPAPLDEQAIEALIADIEEVSGLLDFPEDEDDTPTPLVQKAPAAPSPTPEEEELYRRCVELVVKERKASTSLLQRRLYIGYGRAAKIMDMMEERGVISPVLDSTRAREVLVGSQEYPAQPNE